MPRPPTSNRAGRLTRRALALCLLSPAAWACDDGMGAETAYVSVALTDAEGDVAAVWVEIAEIYLQGGGNGGRISLLAESEADALGPIELTSLAGTTLDLVADVPIPAGNYGQLRFVLEGAALETEGGEVYTMGLDHPTLEATGQLVCPSCELSGIKVTLPGAIADLEAGAHLLVLDFDVAQSFGRIAGGSGAWVMHPVIRGAELGFTGAVTGTVAVGDPPGEIPECPAGTPRDVTAFLPEAVAQTLTDDLGDPLTVTAAVADDGSFTFPFLTPDDYDMGYVAEVGFDGSALTFGATAPGPVTVTSGGALELEYTITSAVCSS